jgi:hypothetical protein
MFGVSLSIKAENPEPSSGVTDESAVPRHRPQSIVARAAPRWAWWLLRLIVTAQAIDAFLQPVFEGRFLSGDFAMLSLHRTNGTYVGVLSMTLLVVALIAWRIVPVPGRVVLGMVALGPVAGLQIFLGFTRTLGIHVPLGVLIIGLSGWLTVWMWTHRPPGRRVADPAGAGQDQS